MKVLGIIAEYNPFHNGHEYHIKEAKKRCNPDYTIVVMSGDFVQRGYPAIIDKHERARAAINAGADMVLMMPVYASLSSAENFAAYGVGALFSTGIVNAISFGCEDEIIAGEEAYELARLVSDEPKEFKEALLEFLKEGNSYSVSRYKAMEKVFPKVAGKVLGVLREKPNNLLAFEYLRAIDKFFGKEKIEIIPIQRNDDGAFGEMSASALREQIRRDGTGHLRGAIPSEFYAAMCDYYFRDCLVMDDNKAFNVMLNMALVQNADEGFEDFMDCGKDFSDRIKNLMPEFSVVSDFVEKLKRKNYSYGRISRVLMHILLGMKNDIDTPLVDESGRVAYLRLLGIKADSTPLISQIKANAKSPFITRLSEAKNLLEEDSKKYFDKDIYASRVYNTIVKQTSLQLVADDMTRILLKVEE